MDHSTTIAGTIGAIRIAAGPADKSPTTTALTIPMLTKTTAATNVRLWCIVDHIVGRFGPESSPCVDEGAACRARHRSPEGSVECVYANGEIALCFLPRVSG